MREIIIDSFVFWPMPVVWLLVIALTFGRRWRWSRLMFGLATLLLVVGSLPITARLLTMPLAAVVPPLDPVMAPAGVAAVVVATAGSFRDAAGDWHSETATLRRVVVARLVRERLGVPLIVAGGAPKGDDQPPEALTAVRDLDLFGLPFVQREDAGRNSTETGTNVAALLRNVTAPSTSTAVVLVTAHTHVARMAAALRHADVHVAAVATTDFFDNSPGPGPSAFLPSIKGLLQVGGALYEYVGIVWYLARGAIDISDLLPPDDR